MLRTRALILAITGADKRAVLARAADETDATLLPVAALLNAPGVTVDVHWSPS
jgi:6-phosphogluconolactonase/glucosamine-6-phosphate isomerase/deaminase